MEAKQIMGSRKKRNQLCQMLPKVKLNEDENLVFAPGYVEVIAEH